MNNLLKPGTKRLACLENCKNLQEKICKSDICWDPSCLHEVIVLETIHNNTNVIFGMSINEL